MPPGGELRDALDGWRRDILDCNSSCSHDVDRILSADYPTDPVTGLKLAPPVAPLDALRGYDAAMKHISCVCGYVVEGDDDDELWKNAQEHLRTDHPDLIGKVSREDILAQAEQT